MRYPLHIIITALSMFYLGKNSFRNIALILRVVNNVKVSHTTISNWCKKFAPLFNNLSLELMPMLNFDSDEWHTDETVVKISGKKYYIWFVIDSETRFVLGFHLSPYRDSNQAFTLFNSVKDLGTVNSIVSDRYSAYKVPVKSVLGDKVKHIRVESFKDELPISIIVEPENAACIYMSALINDGQPHVVTGDLNTIMAGLACGEPNTVTWRILRDFASAYVSCPDYVAARGMRVLANPIGNDKKIVSGESGAVGLGLVTLLLEREELKELKDKLRLDENSVILCFSTEGDTDPEQYRKIVYDGKNPSYFE
jgi:transposase-like protein